MHLSREEHVNFPFVWKLIVHPRVAEVCLICYEKNFNFVEHFMNKISFHKSVNFPPCIETHVPSCKTCNFAVCVYNNASLGDVLDWTV